MKSSYLLFAALIATAALDLSALPVVTQAGSSLKLVAMTQEDAAFRQDFSGSIRVRGKFSAKWTSYEDLSETGEKQTRTVLSVVLRPDQRSTKVLPFYLGRGNVHEVWLTPAKEVIEKILSAKDARALFQRRLTVVTANTELLLTNYAIEVTCDRVTYSANVEAVLVPVVADIALVKGMRMASADGC